MLRLSEERLLTDFSKAIANQEFILYYQPEYNIGISKFDGVEVLIRWKHPQQGMLLPHQFIPLAEKSGFIVDLGNWILKTACQQMKIWQNKGLHSLRVAINVSSEQFKQRNFIAYIKNTLHELNLHPSFLELELNENMIIHDHDEAVIHKIETLNQLGVQIALDDFGTGFASISYLKRIPLNRIKIDKTFIENISTNKRDAAIVQAIIMLAVSLELRVLAEGVETFHQFQKLLAHACHEVQGFYFSKPLQAMEVENFLLHYQTRNFF